MARLKTTQIRKFILHHIPDHPRDVVQLTSQAFGISRQAINRHIKTLEKEGLVTAVGSTRKRSYRLQPLLHEKFILELKKLEEHRVWQQQLRPLIDNLPVNIIDIWHYGSTEMINNAIDHSLGKYMEVEVKKDAVNTEIRIFDDGVGIFRKIQRECGLEDERHAVLELAKGKLTTDPDNHTGEGIFFSSRMFDNYAILSGEVYFSHQSDDKEDWILETENTHNGTSVYMRIKNDSKRVLEDIFDKFKSEDEDYGFTKTIIPVKLIKHGEERLVSRSQAKRLMARVDRFKTVILDFSGVDSIGQAFADEIFRVFVHNNPSVRVEAFFANTNINNMIKRVTNIENRDIDQHSLKLKE